MTARALNAKLGRWENFWSAEPTCAARLVQRGDVLDKSVYALANPVVDHLVQHALTWPGASALSALHGREMRLPRPKGSIFREDGPMPAEVVLRAEVPTGWRGGREDWAAAVRHGVAVAERAAMAERQATGRRVVGAHAVRAASPWDRPRTVEPRRNLRPHVACRNAARRILELGALVAFRSAYAEARAAFVRGLACVFPWGTYKMVRELGCRGAPAPAWRPKGQGDLAQGRRGGKRACTARRNVLRQTRAGDRATRDGARHGLPGQRARSARRAPPAEFHRPRPGSPARDAALIGRYIVDFCAPAARLVVEVDGGYHQERARADVRRDRALEALGYRVIRVSASAVVHDLPQAIATILRALGA